MTTFNSRRVSSFVFNAKSNKRKARGIVRYFAPNGSPQVGWSQLGTDPHTNVRPEAIQRLIEHYLYGCQEEPIMGPKQEGGTQEYLRNEDGSIARKCRNRECGGRTKAKVISDIPRRTVEALGLTFSRADNKIHYEEDGCNNHPHYGTCKVGHPVTMAQIACLPVRVRGHHSEQLTMMDLLARPGIGKGQPVAKGIQIGVDDDGDPVYPGRYAIDKRTGEHKYGSAYSRVCEAMTTAAMGMRRLVESSEATPENLFEIQQGVHWLYNGTKRKEFDPKDENPEEYVGIMPNQPEEDPNHVVMDGTIKDIVNPQNNVALDIGRLHHGDCDGTTKCPGCASVRAAKAIWDQLSTIQTSQTLDEHHIFDQHQNPLNHVEDDQWRTYAASGSDPELRAAYFSAYPQDLPGIGKNYADLGNVAKRNVNVSFLRSRKRFDFISKLKENHQDRKDKRKLVGQPAFQEDFSPQFNMDNDAILAQMEKDPDYYNQQDEDY